MTNFVQLGTENQYYLNAIGLSCMMNCGSMLNANCPSWVSMGTNENYSTTFGVDNITMPMVSTFQNATPISFLSRGPQGSLQYQTPIGLSTTSGPGYVTSFALGQVLLEDDSPGPGVVWNQCGPNASDAIQSDNWTGGIDKCQFQTLSSSAAVAPIDQWMLIPFAQQVPSGNVSVGDVFAITTSYNLPQMLPSKFTTNISFPLGVITNGLTGNDLYNAIVTSSALTNSAAVGFLQLLSASTSLLNWGNHFNEQFDFVTTQSFPNQAYYCSPTNGSFSALNNFLFVVTDNTGSVPSPLFSLSPSFYNCPCPQSQCTICNVKGQLAFRDPISGATCPITCSQQKAGTPCLFQIDPASCPACQAQDCSPPCSENQVCERNLTTGQCQCVVLPSNKRNLISLIVFVVVVFGMILGTGIFVFIRSRQAKKAELKYKQDLLKNVVNL